MSWASLNRARGVKAALAWDTKASWFVERLLDISTSQPEAFTCLNDPPNHQTPGQPPWTSHLAPSVVDGGQGFDDLVDMGGQRLADRHELRRRVGELCVPEESGVREQCTIAGPAVGQTEIGEQ